MALFGDVYFPFDARLHGSRDLAGIPVERSGEQGPRVTERYRLDDKGMVDVVIRDQDSGYERSYRLGRIPIVGRRPGLACVGHRPEDRCPKATRSQSRSCTKKGRSWSGPRLRRRTGPGPSAP